MFVEKGGRRSSDLLYFFEGFVLDSERRELRSGDNLLAIEPQVFDVLEHLIRNRERVVSKDDLIAGVWNGRIVSDVTLDTRVNGARRAIQDNGKEQRLIKTVPRKGIRFVGAVREEQRRADTSPAAIAAQQPGPAFALPDRPSIAVLPFTNLSGDPEQEYFADGIVEDLTTALSHFRWLFVTARNSSFTYKSQAVNVAQVGRELGVRYILEGSVRRVGERVRITAQLLEAERATHIWAQRFDRPVADIFALQDEITDCIAGALEPEISASERDRARRRPPENLGAWELYQRGMWHVLQHNREHFSEAERFFRRATELDPNFAAPHAGLAIVGNYKFARMGADDLAAVAQEMLKEASLAVELDPNDALCHVALGFAHIQQYQLSHATAEHELAVSFNPNSAFARWAFGQVLVRTGQFEKALEQCEAVLRLSPRDPRTWLFYVLRASALYHLHRYEEAARWAHEATRHPTTDSLWPCIYLAGASAQLGRTSEAAAAIAELRRMRPDASVAALLAWPNMRNRSQQALDHIIEGLRKAGLPEGNAPMTRPPLALAFAATLAAVSSATAQVYPSRPITMVVPFPAGGAFDIIGRILANGMKASLGQPVIVENVGGAHGTVGVGRVARASPDGYTLSLGYWGTHVINPGIYALQYDPLNDFEPISLLVASPMVVVSKNTLPAKDMRELVAWLKVKPDQTTLATMGSGSATHISGLLLQKLIGTRFQFVPYRGGGLAIQDLLAGQVDLSILQAGMVLPQVKAGQIRAYAVTAKSRLEAAPGIPAVDEAGVPGLHVHIWSGLWAPKATPKNVIAKLNAAVVDALADPVIRQKLAEIGQEIFPREQQTPEALKTFHAAEIEKWSPIIKAAGIKVE